jgi:Flp pilus assembly protein TadG
MSSYWRSGARFGQRGSFTVELVILTPVVVLFALLAIGLGRFELAREQVVAAAQAAAQAASVAPSAGQAQSNALASASPAVADQQHSCTGLTVETDTGEFFPGGSVQVTVSCRVNYSDLLIPGMPGSTAVRATVTAPIDPFRSVQ